MKQVMQEHRRTGILSAETIAAIGHVRGPCRVEIVLKAGTIVSCVLVGSNGARLTGKEAEQKLAHLGQLRWTFTPGQEVVLSPGHVASSTLVAEAEIFLPQRTAQ